MGTRICYFGTYDQDYCRNQILQRGLTLAGAEVLECHSQVWRTSDKSQLSGAREKLATGLRWVGSRRDLRRQYRRMPDHDAVLVGYLGHLDTRLARSVAHPKPVVLDAFLSLYETVIEDRRMMSAGGPGARLLKGVERRAYESADLILLDTQAHIDYVAEQFRIPAERFLRIFVGADDRLFRPPAPEEDPGPADQTETMTVLFYGKFIPLHGVEVILHAAQILGTERQLRFQLVGTGQTYSEARKLAEELRLDNVDWVDWLPYEDLPRAIREAQVCLGVFAPTGKALRVIPNKVFQSLACGARVVTADSPAMRELPPMGEGLTLVPPGNPEALAQAVRELCSKPHRVEVSPGAAVFHPCALGEELLQGLSRLS